MIDDKLLCQSLDLFIIGTVSHEDKGSNAITMSKEEKD